ncbi:hypothetical protein ABPG72_020581 [Tetrahymena utriculariae]
MQLTMKQKGYITLIGGFILELVTGTSFLWGQLNVYITSYFRQKDDQGLHLSIGGAIFPLMMGTFAAGIPIGIKAIKLFGSARLCCIVFSFLASVAVFISSYSQKFWQFVFIYGVIHGFIQGIVFFIPVYVGYLYFPTQKGMVSGVITCGFGLTAFLFGLIFFSIVNPDGLVPVQDDDGYSYFQGPSIEVAQNVPESLRKLSYIYIGIAFCSSLFIMYHPNQIGEEEKRLKLELKNKEEQKKILQQNVSKLQQKDEQQTPLTEQIHTDKLDNKDLEQSTNSLRKSIQLLHKTIGIVELEQKVIKKQIELTQNQEKQQSYQIVLPHQKSYFDNEFSKDDQLFDNQLFSNNNNNNNNNENNHKNTNNHNNSINPMKACNKNEQYENISLFNFAQKDIKVMDLNKRIISVAKNDIVEDKPQHTNQMIQQDELVDQLSKIKEDINQKESQVKDELQSFVSLEMEIERLNKLGAPSVLTAFKQPQLYVSFLLGILAIGFGLLINGNFKSIAKDYGFVDDSFQTWVGSIGSAANGLSRPLWAGLLDKYQFKHVLNVILGIQIVSIFTMRFTEANQIFFLIWVAITQMTMGSVLSMWPVLSAQLNGVRIGSQLFGLYCFGFSISSMIQFLIVLGLKNSIGFNNIYYIYAGWAVLSVLIITFYPFKVNWSKYYMIKQKNIELPNQKSQQQK